MRAKSRWVGVLALALGLGCVSPNKGKVKLDAEAEIEPAGEDSGAPGKVPNVPIQVDGGAGLESGAPERDGPSPMVPDLGPGQLPPDTAPRLDTAPLPPDSSPSLQPDTAPLPPDAPYVDPGCGAGAHRCSGTCVSDSDPNACGASCQKCPMPSNGFAVCQNGGCDVGCNGGYHACNKQCYADGDVAHCGASCTSCPAVAHGQPICTPGGCDVTCDGGYHACNKACYADSDATHCGSACTSCPVPSNGQALCQGSCGITCNGGFHACGSGCYADNDTSHCGLGCSVCPSVTNGTAACRFGGCEADCNSGSLACTGLPPTCVTATWNFESNTVEGWGLRVQSGYNNAGLSVAPSSARSHGGSRSLAIPVSTNFGQDRFVVTAQVKLCGSGGVDLGGKTISMWAYFAGPAMNASCLSDPYIMTTQGTSYDPNSFNGQSSTIPVANQWFEVKSVVPTNQDHIVHTMEFFTNLNIDGWNGTLYLDDITLR
jgi:hypothetical protein